MSTLVKLDYDGRMPRDFAARLEMALRVHRLAPEVMRIERSGGGRGWHVVLVCRRRVAIMRLVAIQAALGSDWKREMFNSGRAAAWSRVPAFWRTRANVLYRRHFRERT